jgi:putative intracellular protease/amidase
MDDVINSNKNQKMPPVKILIVATSHAQMGESNRSTGLWLEELAIPYYIFKDAGALITLASPKGGLVPLDPKSESIIVSSSTTKRFQKDPEAISLLAHSAILSLQRAEDFDFVFLTGGHGPMWDFAANKPLQQLLEDFNRQHKLIGAVCHGVAGLLSLKNSFGGSLIKGRKLTAFSNTEEEASGLTGVVPFLLESELVSLGAFYSKGPHYESHVVADGNIITGQNPSSSKEVAKTILAELKALPQKNEALLN